MDTESELHLDVQTLFQHPYATLQLGSHNIDVSKHTLVRIEMKNTHNVSQKYYRLTNDQLMFLVTQKHNITAHEVRIETKSKIFFDIDFKLRAEQVIQLNGRFGNNWENVLLRKLMDLILDVLQSNYADQIQVPNDKYSIIDKFKSSRQDVDSNSYKMSWHLVVFPTQFCVQTYDLTIIAFTLNKQINQSFTEQMSDVFPDDINIIDAQVYRSKGNLRLVNCAKIGSNTRKTFVQDVCVNKDQLPFRFLVSKTEGLYLIALQSKYNSQSKDVVTNELQEPIDVDELKNTIKDIKSIMHNKHGLTYVSHKLVDGNIFITYADDNKCIICKDRKHDRNQIYSFVNIARQIIHINCFRNDKKQPPIVYNLQGEPTKQLKQQLSAPIQDLNRFKRHQLEHETICWERYNINTQIVNEGFVNTYPTDFDMLFVKSQMGTGKTKRLLDHLGQFVQQKPQAKVYLVSFRISFSNDHKLKLNQYFADNNIDCQFQMYNELSIDAISSSQYLIIQVESLFKLGIFDMRCDLMILDESESIIQQLNSNLSVKEPVNFSVFKQLVRSSKQIISIDAFLSIRTVDVLCGLRKNQQENRICIINEWRESKNYNFFIGDKSSGEWQQQLVQAVKNGKNIVVPCNVAIVCRAIYELLVAEMPDIQDQICLYTQDINKIQKIHDLSDIQNAWKKYRVLIYSPTILAGISFEQDHFDQIFGYYKAEVNPVENFMQMSGRVRNIKDKTYNILVIQSTNKLPVTIAEIDTQIKQDIIISAQPLPGGLVFDFDDNDNVQILNNGYYNTFLHNTRINNLSTQFPIQRFINCIGIQNQITVFIPVKSTQTSMRQRVQQLKDTEFQQIINAPTINRDQIIQLYESQEDLSHEQLRSKQKYELTKNIPIDAVNRFQHYRDVEKWHFLKQYVEVRNKYQNIHNYIAEFRSSAVLDLSGFNILSTQLESDAQYTIQSAKITYKMKLFELLLNAIGFHNDPLNIDNHIQPDPDQDPDDDQGTSFISKLCVFQFLIYIEPIHLERVQLLKFHKKKIIHLSELLKQKTIQHSNKRIKLLDAIKKKDEIHNIYKKSFKMIKNILSIFGVTSIISDGPDVRIRLMEGFEQITASELIDSTSKMSNLHMSLRKIMIILHLFNIQPDHSNSKMQPRNFCTNHDLQNSRIEYNREYNEYADIDSLLADAFQVIGAEQCEQCFNYIKYAVNQLINDCKQIPDVSKTILLINYNYWNDIPDPIESIRASIKKITRNA